MKFLKGLGLTVLVSFAILPILGWLLATITSVNLAIAMGAVTPLLGLLTAFLTLGGREGRREMHTGWVVLALVLAEILLAVLLEIRGLSLIAGILLGGITLLAVLLLFHQHPGYRMALWLIIGVVLLVALLIFVAPILLPLWSLALWHMLLIKIAFLGFLRGVGPAVVMSMLMFIPTCIAFFVVLITGTDPIADHPANKAMGQQTPVKMPPMIQGRNPLPGGQPYPQTMHPPVRPVRPSANDEDLDDKPVRGLMPNPSRQPKPSQPTQTQTPQRPHRPIGKVKVGDYVVAWVNVHGAEEEWMGEITQKKLGGGATILVAKMNNRVIKPRIMSLPKNGSFDYLDEDEHNDMEMCLHPGQPKF